MVGTHEFTHIDYVIPGQALDETLARPWLIILNVGLGNQNQNNLGKLCQFELEKVSTQPAEKAFFMIPWLRKRRPVSQKIKDNTNYPLDYLIIQVQVYGSLHLLGI